MWPNVDAQNLSKDFLCEVYIASEYNSQRSFQFVADSAESLSDIMRNRGCIFDVSVLEASGSDGLYIQGYKIFRQTIKLSARDVTLLSDKNPTYS